MWQSTLGLPAVRGWALVAGVCGLGHSSFLGGGFGCSLFAAVGVAGCGVGLVTGTAGGGALVLLGFCSGGFAGPWLVILGCCFGCGVAGWVGAACLRISGGGGCCGWRG